MNKNPEHLHFDSSWDERKKFKKLKGQLRGFNRRNADISLIQGDVYKAVEDLIFDSGFKYLALIHYLIRLDISLDEKLLQALLDRTYSADGFQNRAEEDAFRICKEFFPEAIPNVHLGGLGGIEMDILLPFRKVDIEIDKVSSPKRKVTIEDRKRFLVKNFDIDVYRYQYGRESRSEGIEILCEQIYAETRKIVNE